MNYKLPSSSVLYTAFTISRGGKGLLETTKMNRILHWESAAFFTYSGPN